MPQPLELKECGVLQPPAGVASLSWRGGGQGGADATSAASREVCRHFRWALGLISAFIRPLISEAQQAWNILLSGKLLRSSVQTTALEGKSVQETTKTTLHLEGLEGLEELSISHPATSWAPCRAPRSFPGFFDPSCAGQPAWSYGSNPSLTS